MIGPLLKAAVEGEIEDFRGSQLERLVDDSGPFAIKFVQSRWAETYLTPGPLKISQTPALTWGTATYVTPLAFPLSSALYGRVGLVTEFDPLRWRIFDATRPTARMAYVRWARMQAAFPDLLLTVHSTIANHVLRNQFREQFSIDCVLFHPDQEADLHTDRSRHVWMAVTDWNHDMSISSDMSQRLSRARFTVLVDEEFALEQAGLPVQRSFRTLERATEKIVSHDCIDVSAARSDSTLPGRIASMYRSGAYLHVFIAP